MTKRWVIPVSMIALAALTVPAGAETPNGKDAKKNAVTAATKGTASAATQDEQAVWRLEQRYWEYVKQNDVSGYLTLWDERFVGWPGFSENPVEKSSIAEWISPLHANPAESVDYTLTRKAVRSFGDVVVVHYLAHVFFRSSTTGEIVRERSVDRLTHTWQRHGDSWQIITGMSNTPVAAAGLR